MVPVHCWRLPSVGKAEIPGVVDIISCISSVWSLEVWLLVWSLREKEVVEREEPLGYGLATVESGCGPSGAGGVGGLSRLVHG